MSQRLPLPSYIEAMSSHPQFGDNAGQPMGDDILYMDDKLTCNGDIPDEDVAENSNAQIRRTRRTGRGRSAGTRMKIANQATEATAPLLENMDQISGYDAMAQPLPPPSYDEAMARHGQPPQREAISKMPNITEEQAREALLQFVSENCCYGRNAAQELVFTDIKHTSAFYYTLETFIEKRSTNWAYEPLRGQPIDSPANGTAPTPWEIPATPPFLFKKNVMKIEVPHTASVKPCHDCHGIGKRKCHICFGRGPPNCNFCCGTGRTVISVGDSHKPCQHCSGLGRTRCYTCHDHGQIYCKTCDGMASLKCFIQLTVTWTNHVDDHVVKRTALPDELIKQVTGEIALKEEQSRVWPLNQFPDNNINQASQQLVSRSLSSHQMARIIKMRQQVHVIPVAEANYHWKKKMGHFHVYGFEHKVYTPDYPQQCCSCFAIL